jgi:hypothetical protein
MSHTAVIMKSASETAAGHARACVCACARVRACVSTELISSQPVIGFDITSHLELAV